jgi:hypothetical protein
MASADRFYRLLLHLYPAEFRREYGREMTQIFRDRAKHEPPARVCLDVVADLLVTAPREQIDVLGTICTMRCARSGAPPRSRWP